MSLLRVLFSRVAAGLSPLILALSWSLSSHLAQAQEPEPSVQACTDVTNEELLAAENADQACTIDGTAYEYSSFLVFTANVGPPDSGLLRSLKWDYDPEKKPSVDAGTAEEHPDGFWVYRVPGGMAINKDGGASQWTDVLQWGTPGVSSPGLENYVPLPPEQMQALLKGASPELVACDTSQRGWTQVTLTPEAAMAQWRFVSSVTDPTYQTSAGEPLVTQRNARALA